MATCTFGQTKVQGTLKDQNNEPIAFADIYFSNSAEGTTSNDTGNFSLTSKNTYKEVTVSFIGYETQVIQLSGKNTLGLKITLKEEATSLEEIFCFSVGCFFN